MSRYERAINKKSVSFSLFKHRANSYCFEEKYNKLAVELDEKERKHSDNLKLINNFKKEVNMLIIFVIFLNSQTLIMNLLLLFE